MMDELQEAIHAIRKGRGRRQPGLVLERRSITGQRQINGIGRHHAFPWEPLFDNMLIR